MTIDSKKTTIDSEKATINQLMRLLSQHSSFNTKTKEHIQKTYEEFGVDSIFGRTDMQRITGLGSTRTYELIKALLELKIVDRVSGHGKGKYKFASSLLD